jgi:hypothetical protein
MTTTTDRDAPPAGSAGVAGETVDSVTIASYVCDLLGGLRVMTASRANRELEFLDYLLAMAETEAASHLPDRIQ